MSCNLLLGDNHLPFLELGYTAGVTKNFLQNAGSTSSVAINIPGGFTLGTNNQTVVYVSSTLLLYKYMSCAPCIL